MARFRAMLVSEGPIKNALPTPLLIGHSETSIALNRAMRSGHRSYGEDGIDMTQMRRLEEEVAAWPNVSVHPHRFGGREFRFENAELGHVHAGGTVDIPFPRNVRDALL